MNDTIPSVCVKGSILEKIIKNRVKSVFISIALAILLSWIVLREIYPGGVDIYNAVIEENVAKIERYVAHKGRLDLSGLLTGVTPLCYALVHDKPESFKALLENGASPNAFSRDGFSAVHLAARNDNPYWINACLQHGADLHLLTSRGAIRGSRVTPFGYASYYDQFNNVSIMAKSGMDMNAPVDEHGN
ncbi:MAG: ankyrin repeat domain-containing protein, partial [Planctomycetaceae bacterium]|nr:ankyrin repeat domain-containing protein [Planctomycetaceae bacterium]